MAKNRTVVTVTAGCGADAEVVFRVETPGEFEHDDETVLQHEQTKDFALPDDDKRIVIFERPKVPRA